MSNETKIKANQIDLSGAGITGVNEYIITEQVFEDYKVQYKDTDEYYINLAQLIEDEELEHSVINLNRYSGFFDGNSFNEADITIKNGELLLDNIEDGGCGRALVLNDAYLHIEDMTIKAPQCEADSMAIIEITNSSLGFSNCDIYASTNTNNKVFIKLMTTDTNHCDVQLLGTSLNYSALDDSGNIEFTFIKTTSNNCHVEIKDCNRLRVANDVGEANCKFLQTDTDTTVDLNIYNSTIAMEGWNIGDCLNVNLDNSSINANNNTFIGRLVARYETAEQTVSEKGYPNTLEEGEQIWDLGVIPERDWDSMEEFYLDDMWTFFDKADIDPNDMSKAWERYEFSIREISNQRGFILNFDESKSYTTDDFEDLEEWGCSFDGNIEDHDIGNWGAIEIHPDEQRYRANEEVTYENELDFQEKVQEGKIGYSAQNVYQFNNNAIQGYIEGHGIFQNASGKVVCSSLLTNAGKIEFGDLWSKQEGQTLVCRDGKFRPEYISASKEIKILNVTQAGTLARDGSVYSGFSHSNYLQSGDVLNGTYFALPIQVKNFGDIVTAVNTWEFVAKFKYKQYSAMQTIWGQDGSWGCNVGINENGYLKWQFGNDDDGEDVQYIIDNDALVDDTDYFIKILFDGTKYEMLKSTNGTSWTSIGTITTTQKITRNEGWRLGSYYSNSAFYLRDTTLDIADCYIKVDDEYWWKGIETI